jgi:ribonuclease P/MRP protein subunit POP5
MVRLKHRYLLINILYPLQGTAAAASRQIEVLDMLQFHAPSPSKFDEPALVRLIRDSVTELFGDYGAGKVGGSLKGIFSVIVGPAMKSC